jgi:hypothetical protein
MSVANLTSIGNKPYLNLSVNSINVGGNALSLVNQLELNQKSPMLLPRLTSAQRNALASNQVGQFIYNTDLNAIQTWTGSQWNSLVNVEYLQLLNQNYASIGAANATSNNSLSKIGNIASYSLNNSLAIVSTSSSAQLLYMLPNAFFPSNTMNFPYSIAINGIWQLACLQVNPNGSVYVLLDPNGSPLPSGDGIVMPSITVCWNMA